MDKKKKPEFFCPWCGGKGKIQKAHVKEAPWVDCFYCEAHGQQGPAWDKACNQAGVPGGTNCTSEIKNCPAFKNGCLGKHGPSNLRVDPFGQPLKNATCVEEISALVRKNQAKNHGKKADSSKRSFKSRF